MDTLGEFRAGADTEQPTTSIITADIPNLSVTGAVWYDTLVAGETGWQFVMKNRRSPTVG